MEAEEMKKLKFYPAFFKIKIIAITTI